jgi:hypothetical protein
MMAKFNGTVQQTVFKGCGDELERLRANTQQSTVGFELPPNKQNHLTLLFIHFLDLCSAWSEVRIVLLNTK